MIKNVDVIVNNLDDNEAAKRSIKQINKNSYNFVDSRPKIREDGDSKPFFHHEDHNKSNNGQTVKSGKYSTENN